MYNFHPAIDFSYDPSLTWDVQQTLSEAPGAICVNWLTNILGLQGERPESGRLQAYCTDPFVIGFAHGFCLDDSSNWVSADEDPEAWAREMFQYVFGEGYEEVHERAKLLKQSKNSDYLQGARNGVLFRYAYYCVEEYAGQPEVAEAMKRAAAAVAARTEAGPDTEEYWIWMDDALQCALYDVLFLDIARSRVPSFDRWNGSALETMPDADLSELTEEVDYEVEQQASFSFRH
ncbi:MAG TPA: hypothetical protein VND94_18850 [Terriglobia bacterium]|nr:hypothetical protein [Terriglobia bacterium]